MKALLSILIFSAMILMLMYGILAEMDLRDLKYNNRRAYIQMLEDRALAERYADPAYQDYRTAVHRRAK